MNSARNDAVNRPVSLFGVGLGHRRPDSGPWAYAGSPDLQLHGADPAPQVVRAWARLVRGGGRLPIRQLADDVGWSHKHLITRFTEQVGVAPKTAARPVRFERVLQRTGQQGAARWDQVAAETGYTDQSHLIRDFHAFTGLTPTEYASRPGRTARSTTHRPVEPERRAISSAAQLA